MTLLLSLLATPAPATEACEPVTLADLIPDAAPAIVVLGETPGEPDDLRRATRVVKALRGRGPVTVAVEAVHHSRDGSLQALRAPSPGLERLAAAVDWEQHWRWPVDGYRPLFDVGLSDVPGGVRLIAVGPDRAPPVGMRLSTLPAGYGDRLARLAGQELPVSMRERLAEARTWSDARIVERALNAWKGEGYLVIVADRTRVAGPGGVDWQLRERVSDPVIAATLDWSDLDCVDGTLQWRSPLAWLTTPAFGSKQ